MHEVSELKFRIRGATMPLLSHAGSLEQAQALASALKALIDDCLGTCVDAFTKPGSKWHVPNVEKPKRPAKADQDK